MHYLNNKYKPINISQKKNVCIHKIAKEKQT